MGNLIALPVRPEYAGWSLTYYQRHYARDREGHPIIGTVLTAESVEELLSGYSEPLWLSPESPIPPDPKALKDASPCVTAGLIKPGEARSHAAAGLARVLFVDFDHGRDGSEGLSGSECLELVSCLESLGKCFVIHTTSSTPWLPGDRAKLRLVMPLLEPVLPEAYGRLWLILAQHVEKQVGLLADSTKKHPGDLLYRAVFHPSHADRWRYWRSSPGVESLVWDVPVAAGREPEGPYERVRKALNKNDALFRVSYGLGRRWAAENLESASDETAVDAHLTAVVWPELRRGLADNTISLPVKDWAAAEHTVRRKFALAVRDELREQTNAAGEYRTTLISELRETVSASWLDELGRANGHGCKPLAGVVERAGRLLAGDLGLDDSEAHGLRNRVIRAVETNHNESARTRLLAAWNRGLGNPVDVAREAHEAARLARDRASWRELDLVLDSRGFFPQVNATNCLRLWNRDPNLRGLLARDVRSENDSIVVQREFRGLSVGEVVDLRHSRMAEWFAGYVGECRQMPGLLVEEYDRSAERVLGELAGVDPVATYLRGLDCAGGELDTFFIRHGGAEDTPLTRAITRAFFLSAVRAVFEPGCETNYMWVLIGEQGIGKSLLLKRLCADARWFGTIEPEEITGGAISDGGRKPRLTAAKSLVSEIPEIYLSGKAVTQWKSFISDYRPSFRLPYARGAGVFPRRGILVATSNPGLIFKDTTGNRRFLPLVLTRRIDLDAVSGERDSLWASAYRAYIGGESSGVAESLWSELASRQEEHRAVSSVEDRLQALTDGAEGWPLAGLGTPGSYEPTLGLRAEWMPVSAKGGQSGDTPRCLNLGQLASILRVNNTRQLTDCLTKVGWKYRRSREFFANSNVARMWVHPASVSLLR